MGETELDKQVMSSGWKTIDNYNTAIKEKVIRGPINYLLNYDTKCALNSDEAVSLKKLSNDLDILFNELDGHAAEDEFIAKQLRIILVNARGLEQNASCDASKVILHGYIEDNVVSHIKRIENEVAERNKPVKEVL